MSMPVRTIQPTAENIVEAEGRVNESIGFTLLFGFLTLVCGIKMFTVDNEVDIVLWGVGAIITILLTFVAVFSASIRADVLRQLERGEPATVTHS